MNNWIPLKAKGGNAKPGMMPGSLVMVLSVPGGLMMGEAGAAGGARYC